MRSDEEMEEKDWDSADALVYKKRGIKHEAQTTVGSRTKRKDSKKTRIDSLTLTEEDFDKIKDTIQMVT